MTLCVAVAMMGTGCATLREHLEPKRDDVVDRSTLDGKVMAGYQGWFACPGDELGRGWYHWGIGTRFDPDHCTIDLWPDVSELDEDELCPTDFRHADGSVAYVFSSQNFKTVRRHFQWMQEYGIDGAFVQRFGSEVTAGELQYEQFTRVLHHSMRAANQHGRAYSLTYDLSGMRAGQVSRLKDDFNRLLEEEIILGPDDDAFLYHRGRPLISVWGIGFSDDRLYTLEECAEFIHFLRNHPGPNGDGFSIMLGVPTYWRTLERDALEDPYLHDVIRMADVVWPWSVGRYRTPEAAQELAHNVWAEDMAWCDEEGLDYLPVVFPGFSWHNLKPEFPLDLIPRLGGRFLWSQYVALAEIGSTMAYAAMFDEVDEATAIFKCTNDPPVNGSFIDYEGLPEDHYLWLTGMGARLLRGEIDITEDLPERK